jgi:hypothetical protein
MLLDVIISLPVRGASGSSSFISKGSKEGVGADAVCADAN